MNRVSLDALARRVSRMAEDMFHKQGQVDAFWLIENADGKQALVATPVSVPPGVPAWQYKNAMAAWFKAFFAEYEVSRYARASEAWTLDSGENADGWDSLAEHPRRKEAIYIEAADGREHLTAIREIHRPEGGEPYLAKLVIERPDELKGRWLGVLPAADDRRARQ
jgi:hypothetical protein